MTEPVAADLRVLIAPDCFGDSLTAVAAAEAIGTGWRRARPGDAVAVAPQSDGGPGFLDVLIAAGPDLERRQATVSGPLTEDIDASWVWDRRTSTAYIECAQACGLSLLGGPPTTHTALAAHSRGVGQLIDQALSCGPNTLVVGLGGSSCTDGGRGMLDALGGYDSARDALAAVDLIVATDVEHPLIGPSGAARVFGPQKGADGPTVELLEARLNSWAGQLAASAGQPIGELPGAGAAGGLGAALLALGGRRESGATLIVEHTGTAGQIARADLLITGEGRLDDQSVHGKVVGSLAAVANVHRTTVIVLAGQVALSAPARQAAGIAAAHSLADFAGSVRLAIEDAARQLSGLAFRTAGELHMEPKE